MNVLEVQPNYKENLKTGTLTVSPSNAGDSIYPIGSLYLTLDQSEICPLQKLGFGKWELLPSNFCLQTASSTNKAGSTVSPALPNIKGQVGTVGEGVLAQQQSKKFMPNGAFYGFENQGANVANNSGDSDTLCFMDASRYNSIYKDDCNTVQPPAILVNVWKRVS